jgi:hypothetical protein
VAFTPVAAFALDARFTSSVNDADALLRGGDLEGASETLEQALAAARAILGAEHPDVAELTSRLSLLYLYRNDVGRAEQLAESALALREKHYGKYHPAVASSLMDLASIRLVQGRDEEAGKLYRRVVDLWTHTAGPDDVRTVQARANLADFLEARGQLAEAQELRETNPRKPDAGDTRPPVAACAFSASALKPPAWDAELSTALFKIALDHEDRIAHALQHAVHHFSGLPSRAEFDTVFPIESGRAYELAQKVHALVKERRPAIVSLFALIYAAREHLNVAALEREASSPQDAPDYFAIVSDVRRRALVGIARFELTRTPGFAAWLDDTGSLLARREQIAKLLRPAGYAENNEIKYRPQFLACVATARPTADFDYDGLRAASEVIARNGAALDAYLRFIGVDVDAVLKAHARAQKKGDRGLEQVAAGVQLDRFNKVVFIEQYPTSFTVHLQPSARDRTADIAALVSQWEHGAFPRASRSQVEEVMRAVRRYTDNGPFAEFLDAITLDLRTRYPEAAAEQDTVTWEQPRVGRWERSRVDRDQHNTYYELQFDTHGSFALPANDLYLTKRLDSPVGMMLGIALRQLDLPKHALDAFAKQLPILHVAVLPDLGLTFEVYTHPRDLSRAPGVKAAAFGETPLKPPPSTGWEFTKFAPVGDDEPAEDRVLLDVRPIPGIDPSEARSFGLHVCLLTPLDAWSEGKTVRFTSPIWRDPKDVPGTARFLVYRRTAKARGAQWEEIAGKPLSLAGGLDYPEDRVSPLAANMRNGYVEFSFTDLTADAGKAYEYQIIHRCALKPYPDNPLPRTPAHPDSSFEIVSIEHAPESSLRCHVRKGFGGIARPWVRVRYRVHEGSAKKWRDSVSVLDPSGHELSGRNAVTTRRDPPDTAFEPGSEYSLLTSVAACTEGPYRFNIRLEGDGFSREIAETLYVSVARDP